MAIYFRHNWKGNDYETMNYNDFINALSDGKDYYEHTGGKDELACFYFDFDEYINEETWNVMNEESDSIDFMYRYEEYEKAIIENILDYLPKENNNFAIMRNHRIVKDKYKFSLRLNFYELVGKKTDFKKMVDYMKKNVPQLDSGVYDPNRKMRCVFTAKPETMDKPLELVKGTVEQTLIQYFKGNDNYTTFNWDDFVSINNVDINKLNKKNEMNFEGDTDTESVSSDIANMDLTEYKDMGDIDLQLSILKHCFQKGQRNKWMKIGCILKKTLPYEEALQYFLSHSYVAPYDNEETKQYNIKQFNEWDNTKNGYNKNSLMKFCKEENRDLTLMLFPYENFNGYLKDATDCCCMVDKLKLSIKHTTAYDGINWYSLNDKNLWVVADPEYNITREILRYIDFNYNYLNKQFNEADEDEREKLTDKIYKLMTFRKQVCNSCNITNKIKKQLSSLILDTDFGKKLDAKLDVWAFENGVLNLKTGQFRKGFRSDDYLTRHLDYKYNKNIDNDKLNYLKEQFKKVLNYNDEHLNYFMSIIGASLTGNSDKLKQIYFGVDGCDGIGNNGKTNTFSIINDIFNIYVYKTNKTLLEEDNTKLHKQMIKTKGMRIVWADEWGKKKPNYELMKTIGDGLDYENEIMYGTSEIFKVMWKMFILTNHIPNLSSDEEAVYNRFRQITFGSHFDTQGNTTEENYENLQFIADVSMRENIVNNYKNEMIAWVLEYSKKFLIDYKIPSIPAKFVNDTKETKNSNDLFRQIIEDDYEEGDEDDYVSIYDIMIKSKIRDDKNGKKKIISKMKQLPYKTTYNKDKQVNKKKGVFYGIREILDED